MITHLQHIGGQKAKHPSLDTFDNLGPPRAPAASYVDFPAGRRELGTELQCADVMSEDSEIR